jgi:integrin beta 1
LYLISGLTLIRHTAATNGSEMIGGKTSLTNPCLEQITCSGCIGASAACVWCVSPNHTEARCDFHNNLLHHGCSEVMLQNPVSSMQLLRDEALSERSALAGQESPVQLRPQRVQLRLRPHNSQTLKMQYKQALDYPVDLYYLMDLSKSMEDDKDKLSQLSMSLSEEMQKITSNFRLGFGSFVDKVVMPYVSTVPEKYDTFLN